MDPIRETMQRTQRYWYIDGLTEIVTGVFLLLLSLHFWLLSLLAGQPLGNWVLAVGQPLLVVLAVFGGGWLVRYMKTRLTYRRTGYVAYRRQAPKRQVANIAASIAVAAGMALFVTLIANRMPQNWLAGVSGALMALALALVGFNMGLPRFIGLGAWVLLVGLFLVALAPGDPWDFVILFATLGLGTIATGAWTLNQYLRHTRPAQEGQE